MPAKNPGGAGSPAGHGGLSGANDPWTAEAQLRTGWFCGGATSRWAERRQHSVEGVRWGGQVLNPYGYPLCSLKFPESAACQTPSQEMTNITKTFHYKIK